MARIDVFALVVAGLISPAHGLHLGVPTTLSRPAPHRRCDACSMQQQDKP
tara:strand:+ start:79 stop:228 length:150 start_codon:yes stop_codon:yes gene_type:complete